MGGARALLTCAPLAHKWCNCNLNFLLEGNYIIFNLKSKFYCQNIFRYSAKRGPCTVYVFFFVVICTACSQ